MFLTVIFIWGDQIPFRLGHYIVDRKSSQLYISETLVADLSVLNGLRVSIELNLEDEKSQEGSIWLMGVWNGEFDCWQNNSGETLELLGRTLSFFGIKTAVEDESRSETRIQTGFPPMVFIYPNIYELQNMSFLYEQYDHNSASVVYRLQENICSLLTEDIFKIHRLLHDLRLTCDLKDGTSVAIIQVHALLGVPVGGNLNFQLKTLLDEDVKDLNSPLPKTLKIKADMKSLHLYYCNIINGIIIGHMIYKVLLITLITLCVCEVIRNWISYSVKDSNTVQSRNIVSDQFVMESRG